MRRCLFFFGVLLLFFSSCTNIEEEIIINENKGGTYKMYSDMLPAMSSMGIQMAKAFAKEGQTINEDSIKMLMEMKIWSDVGGEIDSVIDYSSQVPDSIKNDPTYGPIIEKTKGYMRGSQAEGKLYMGVDFDFDNTTELGTFMKLLNESSSSGKQNGPMGSLYSGESETQLIIEGKVIKRITKVKKKADISDQDLKSIKTFLGEAVYRTTVTAPGEISKVKGQGLVSYEGNKARFEYDMIQVLKNEVNTNFTITFK